MPVGPGTTGQGGGGTAAAGQAGGGAAAAGPGPGTGPGGAGPPSVADAGGGTGGHGSSVGLGSYGGRGPANPAAASRMNAELGKGISRTGDPDNPFGEMTGRQEAQIGRSRANAQDTAFGVEAFAKGMPVVGSVMGMAESLGLVSFGDPGDTAVADAYGNSTLSGLFGNYSDDPGIQAATEAHFGSRATATAAHMAGRDKGGGMPSTTADKYLVEEEETGESLGTGIYTPPPRPGLRTMQGRLTPHHKVAMLEKWTM